MLTRKVSHPELETLLARGSQQLLAYIQYKVHDPQLAEDILQDSLLKALQAAPNLRSREKLIPWFYRIVQRAIADTYRKHRREQQAYRNYAEAAEEASLSPEDRQMICRCFQELLPTLRPAYRHLIEAIDLNGKRPKEVAQELGITPNNLHVRLHRARRQLRQRLETACTFCPDHSYFDCAC